MTIQTYLVVAGVIDLIVGFTLGRTFGRMPGKMVALLAGSAGLAFGAISIFIVGADLAIGTGRVPAALAAVLLYGPTNVALSLGAVLFCWLGTLLKPSTRPF